MKGHNRNLRSNNRLVGLALVSGLYCKVVLCWDLLALVIFSGCAQTYHAYMVSRIQAMLVQVTSLTEVAEYMLQLQAVRQGPDSSIHAVLQSKLRYDLT